MIRPLPFMSALVLTTTLAVTASADAASVELAQTANSGAQRAKIDVEVETKCVDGNPYFRIVNRGEEWPEPAELKVLRTENQEIVVSRLMRMKTGQNATFKLPTDRLGRGEYGVRLEPSWYDRDAGYDARQSCD